MAMVIAKGDVDAGAIYIQTLDGDGDARLYGPTQGETAEDFNERFWRFLIHQPKAASEFVEGPKPIDEYLARQRKFDPDIWVIEIEDREGRHFLGERLRDV